MLSSELTKYNGLNHSGLTRFDGKALGFFTARRTGSDETVREMLLLSHEAEKGPPCFSCSFSQRSLGAAGSTPRPRLGQQLMSKGLYMFNPSFVPLL